jgi:hypothetical protein
MSFAFALAGTPKKVIEDLERVAAHGDASYCDAAKKAVREIASSAPEGATLVAEAVGHHDYSGRPTAGHEQIGQLELKIKIFKNS